MTVVRGDGGIGMTVARVTRPAGWLVARALVGSSLALVAGAAFAPTFGPRPEASLTDTRFMAVLCGSVGIVTAVCLLLWAGTRLTPMIRSAAALAALAGYVLLVVAPGWRVLSGPKLLLTGALPVEPAGPELATVVVAVGLAALTGVEPALRGRGALVQMLGPLVVTGLGWGCPPPLVRRRYGWRRSSSPAAPVRWRWLDTARSRSRRPVDPGSRIRPGGCAWLRRHARSRSWPALVPSAGSGPAC
jgi:hypothetical protein